MVGVSDKIIRKWEAGEHVPSVLHFAAWAEALGWRIEVTDGEAGSGA